MTLKELRKIECSQYVHYNNTTAYLYVSTKRKYYLFSNDPSLDGSDPEPEVRSALGYSYSYWLASMESHDDCDHYWRHITTAIIKKGRRPI